MAINGNDLHLLDKNIPMGVLSGTFMKEIYCQIQRNKRNLNELCGVEVGNSGKQNLFLSHNRHCKLLISECIEIYKSQSGLKRYV